MKRKIIKDNKSNPHSREGRIALAGMLIRLFELWKLPPADQLSFLGLSSPATLARYRKGGPLANRRDLMDRVGCLLAIHQSLRILFPHNRQIVYGWMTTLNRDFEGNSPAHVVREKGFLGLQMVRRYLEFERER